MPQIFQVLRCYKCSVFQVHQTRKDNKWTCKICGEKQSVKRHYGLGTSRDCRTHVQKLNKMRGEKDKASINIIDSEDSDCGEKIDDNISNNVCDTHISNNINKESKWSVYIDKRENNDEIREPVYLSDEEVFLEIPQKRKINRCQKIKYSNNLFDVGENCKVNMNNHSELAVSATKDDGSVIKKFELDTQEACLKTIVKPQIDTNVRRENQKNNFVPQKVNKGSKWAQFIDSQQGFDEDDDKNTEISRNTQNLFSLCDDSEIDTILDL